MRDWTKAFRRASFRGVRFWVDDEGFDGGRRVAVQHIAYGERPVTEDFGQATRTTPVVAYVAGDQADREALALSAALSARGPSMLVLPMQAPRLSHVAGFSLSRGVGRNGYVAFDVSFLDAGGAPGFATGFSGNAALAVFDTASAAAATALRGA